MQPNLSPIERAFQLAATSRYSTVSEIKLQLAREGYPQEQVEGRQSSPSVDIIVKARRGDGGH